MSEQTDLEHQLLGSLPEQAECEHFWRVVECDGDRDTLECAKCKRRRETSCNFDEDYA